MPNSKTNFSFRTQIKVKYIMHITGRRIRFPNVLVSSSDGWSHTRLYQGNLAKSMSFTHFKHFHHKLTFLSNCQTVNKLFIPCSNKGLIYNAYNWRKKVSIRFPNVLVSNLDGSSHARLYQGNLAAIE